MTQTLTASQTLDREFLEIRCRILDIAAALDRIDRCDRADPAQSDPRREQLAEAIRLLIDGGHHRAERVQMVFSDPYDEAWRSAIA